MPNNVVPAAAADAGARVVTRHGYLVAAAAVPPGDLAPLRSVVRGLVLPGQRRVHMNAVTTNEDTTGGWNTPG